MCIAKKYLVLILAASLLLFCACADKEEQNESKAAMVEVAEVQMGDLTNSIQVNGTIFGVNEVIATPLMGGTVEKVLVAMGDKVQKGDLLFSLVSGDAAAMLAQAQANYSDAKNNYNRTQTLYNEGAVAQNMLEQAQTGLKGAEAALQQASTNFKYTQITAPITGQVASINAVVGQVAAAGQTSARIIDNKKMKLKATVSEKAVGKLAVGQKEEVVITSLGQVEPIYGTISAIAPAADLQTMTFPIEITIDNANGKIKSGMFGEANLGQDHVQNAVIIPQEALVNIDGNKVVFVVKDGLAELRAVEIGIENDELLEVKSGVKAGEQVVTRGNASLRDGQQVEIRSNEQTEDLSNEAD